MSSFNPLIGLSWIIACGLGYLIGYGAFFLWLQEMVLFWGQNGRLMRFNNIFGDRIGFATLSLHSVIIDLPPIFFIALGTSALQAIILRRYFPDYLKWIRLTLMGTALGMGLSIVAFAVSPGLILFPIMDSLGPFYEQEGGWHLVTLMLISTTITKVLPFIGWAIGQGLVWKHMGLPHMPWIWMSGCITWLASSAHSILLYWYGYPVITGLDIISWTSAGLILGLCTAPLVMVQIRRFNNF